MDNTGNTFSLQLRNVQGEAYFYKPKTETFFSNNINNRGNYNTNNGNYSDNYAFSLNNNNPSNNKFSVQNDQFQRNSQNSSQRNSPVKKAKNSDDSVNRIDLSAVNLDCN